MDDDKHDRVPVQCIYKGASKNARLVSIDGRDYWVAKSISTIEIPITLHVPEWWLRKKDKSAVQTTEEEEAFVERHSSHEE